MLGRNSSTKRRVEYNRQELENGSRSVIKATREVNAGGVLELTNRVLVTTDRNGVVLAVVELPNTASLLVV